MSIDARLHIALLMLLPASAAVIVLTNALPLFEFLIILLFIICLYPIVKDGFKLYSFFQQSLLFYMVTYGIRPLFGEQHMAGSLDDLNDVKIMAMFYSILYAISLVAGYYLFQNKTKVNDVSNLVPTIAWNPKKVTVLLFVTVSLGLVCFLFLCSVLGVGILDFYRDAYVIRERISTMGSGLYFLKVFIIWAVWLAFWVPLVNIFAKKTKINLKRKISLFAIFLCLAAFMLAFGQRGFIVLPVVYFFFLLSLTYKHYRITRMLMVFVPLFLIFSSIYIYYRNLTIIGSANIIELWNVLKEVNITALLKMGVETFSDKFENFVRVVYNYQSGNGDYFYGITYLSMPLLFVPQSYFSWKPIYTDAYLTDKFSPFVSEGAGLAFGILSEFYINFNFMGIVLGGILLGLIVRKLDTFIERRRNNPNVLLWYATSGGIIFQLVVGGLYTVTMIEFLLTSLWTGFFIMLCVKIKSKQKSIYIKAVQ